MIDDLTLPMEQARRRGLLDGLTSEQIRARAAKRSAIRSGRDVHTATHTLSEEDQNVLIPEQSRDSAYALQKHTVPGLGKLAVNFSGAVKRAATAAVKGDDIFVETLTKDTRLAICRMCEMRSGSRCTHPACGCLLKAKAAFATEQCPLGRW